jgi:hypothetical protein
MGTNQPEDLQFHLLQVGNKKTRFIQAGFFLIINR